MSATLFLVKRAKIGCVSGLVGGFAIFVSIFVIDLSMDSVPGTFYKVVGLPLGLFGTDATLFGMISHMLVASLIGTVFGLGSGLGRKLEIRSFKKGIVAGIVTGVVVFSAFFVPISTLVIIPQIQQDPIAASEAVFLVSNVNFLMFGALELHVVYGAIMGTFFAIAVQYETKRQIMFQGV